STVWASHLAPSLNAARKPKRSWGLPPMASMDRPQEPEVRATGGAAMEAIRISEADLERSGQQIGLAASDIHGLWLDLQAAIPRDVAESRARRVDVSKVLFYGGGSVALVAMSVFMGEGWASWGDGFGLFVALFYTALFAGFTGIFGRKGWDIPRGLM